MADEKKIDGARCKLDTVCVKCAEPILGWMTSRDKGVTQENAEYITWSRTPRADGIKVQWHTKCNGLPDNADVIAAKLAKKGLPVPAPSASQDDDDGEEQPSIKAAPKATSKPTVAASGGDFLAGMAIALLPYLEDKIKVSTSELSTELETKIADAVTKASRVIVVDNKRTGETKDVGRQHERFPDLLTLVASGYNVYMLGSPGSGKSTAAIKVAESLGLRYGYISLSAQTAESRLLGFMDANGKYVDTEFHRCYKDGGVFCIDEMDNASANLLTALNSALENGRAAFPCGVVEQHKDFVLVATGNTSGYGANPMFPERRPMDAAFRERFVFLSWEYDESLERDLALGVNPSAEKWVTWVQTTRKYAAQHFPKMMVTPRASIKGAGLIRDFNPPQVAEMVIFKGFDKDSTARILAANPFPRM